MRAGHLERELQHLRQALAQARQREQALQHELQHRVRNMLAVLRSIYRRSHQCSGSQEKWAEHFAAHFEGRLGAIARHQPAITSCHLGTIELEDMVREELLAGQCREGSGCVIDGPLVLLDHKGAALMGLALHELTTNAIKFGALLHGGALTIQWSVTGPPAQRILNFLWVEAGVPTIAVASRPRGFGHEFIEDALPYQLGATTRLEFRPGGLVCSIVLSLPPAPGTIDIADCAGATVDLTAIFPSNPEN